MAKPKEISDFSRLAGRISRKNRLFLTNPSFPFTFQNAAPLPVVIQQSYRYQGLNRPLSRYIYSASRRKYNYTQIIASHLGLDQRSLYTPNVRSQANISEFLQERLTGPELNYDIIISDRPISFA